MKHSLFIFAFLLSCLKLSALYMGNPDEPEIIQTAIFTPEDAIVKFKLGYQGDFVFDRRLKAYDGVQGRIDTCSFHTDQGVLTLTFLDRIDVYGSVGAIETEFSHRPKIDHNRREYQSNYSTTWGVGGRLVLFTWDNTTLGMQGGFQWANPHIKWDALNGTAFTTDAVMRYREWQIAAGVSHQIDLFIPYLGIQYSNVHALLSQLRPDLELGRSHFRMRNRDYFGLVVGCTLSPGKWIDLTIEVRMIDEQALSLAGNAKF